MLSYRLSCERDGLFPQGYVCKKTKVKARLALPCGVVGRIDARWPRAGACGGRVATNEWPRSLGSYLQKGPSSKRPNRAIHEIDDE